MEEFSSKETTPKQKISVAANYSSSKGVPCNLLERVITGILNCLGFDSISDPNSLKQGEHIETHTSFDPLPSTKGDGAVKYEEATGRIPKQVPIDSGSNPQVNSNREVTVSAIGRSPTPPNVDPGNDPQVNSKRDDDVSSTDS
ncbi:uncharacterized protein LOC122072031 [Macadamia integrifolia]|uniref:uncharacterized protein LOC122072031 n=1 Tax=Macadamia integrifolia TaxID=60698 RepID=UPI001C4FEE3D|nr:uncharacterized protein LOC122072031 [Macadamia integrifolia]